MARLPYLDAADVAPEYRDLLSRGLNLYRALVHSPESARQLHQVGMHIRHHMRLDPRLRELAILQVGYLARAPYEYAHHIEIGRAVGVSDDDLRALARESAGEQTALAALDRTVLAAARELFHGTALSETTHAALAAALDEEERVELVVAISIYCAVVRMLGALEIDLEDGYQHLLEQFPFAASG